MRTILYHRYGEGTDVLDVGIVPAPPAPASGELLIRVLLRPIHHGDLLGVAGRYRAPDDLSEVPAGGKRAGFEGMGIVEAIGPDVDPARGFDVGDRVAFFPASGAWSESVVAPARFVTRLDDRISNEVAAQLHVNPLTAVLLMRVVEEAGISPGRGGILVTAAGASVAKLTIALALSRGFNVIGVVRSAKGRDELAALFPSLSVVVADRDDWPQAARLMLGERSVNAVLDCIGGDTAARAFSLVENGGTLVSYGDLSGQPIPLPALPFATRDLKVRGVSVGSWPGLSDGQRSQDLSDAVALAIGDPKLFPVAATYELADAAKAASHVHRAGKAGAILLSSR